VVLYGCETCSLTLREGHRLRVFENRVLRIIFGLTWDEVIGELRANVMIYFQRGRNKGANEIAKSS
jgi:hypothetical protein